MRFIREPPQRFWLANYTPYFRSRVAVASSPSGSIVFLSGGTPTGVLLQVVSFDENEVYVTISWQHIQKFT